MVAPPTPKPTLKTEVLSFKNENPQVVEILGNLKR
jgi:hypothetical protein